MDEQLATDWKQALDEVAHRINPVHGRIFEPWPQSHHWRRSSTPSARPAESTAGGFGRYGGTTPPAWRCSTSWPTATSRWLASAAATCASGFSRPSTASPPRRRPSARISRQLRLLRDHGLIRKLPDSYRYRLTDEGTTFVAALHAVRRAPLERLDGLAA